MIALLLVLFTATTVLSVIQILTAWYGRRALFGNERGHGTKAYRLLWYRGRSPATQGAGGCHPTLGFFTTTNYARKENIPNDVR